MAKIKPASGKSRNRTSPKKPKWSPEALAAVDEIVTNIDELATRQATRPEKQPSYFERRKQKKKDQQKKFKNMKWAGARFSKFHAWQLEHMQNRIVAQSIMTTIIMILNAAFISLQIYKHFFPQ